MASDDEQCFYCDQTLIARRRRQDYFPIPQRTGGTETVTSCAPCLEIKKGLLRSKIDHLVAGLEELHQYVVRTYDTSHPKDLLAAWKVAREGWNKLSRDGRLTYAWYRGEAEIRNAQPGSHQLTPPAMRPAAQW